MNHLRASAARSGGQISRLEQRHPQPAGRGGSGQTRSGNAATDDDEIKGLFFEGTKETRAVAKIEVPRTLRRVEIHHGNTIHSLQYDQS